jgi:hypothetical protein
MKHRSYILVLSLLTLATLSIAQDQRETSAKAQERITREVRHELLMLPYFGVFDNIAFKVDGYNVTLLGQVVRPSLKSDAENAVKHIEGVEKIDNQIEVLPPRPRMIACASPSTAPSTATPRSRNTRSACRSPFVSS